MTSDLTVIEGNLKDYGVPSVNEEVLKTLTREEVLAWEAT